MTEQFRRLGDLRRLTGTSLFVFAFAARLPVSMNIVGMLTLVTVVRESVTDGGLVSAALGLAAGFGGPVLGIIADRIGQRAVLIAVAILHAATVVSLIVAVYAGVPLIVLVAIGAVAGLTLPPSAPLMRARWLAILRHDIRAGGRGLSIALGYESMADEIAFVGGPVLVGALALLFGPAAPLALAAVLVLVFVIAFALHPTAALVDATDETGTRILAPRRELFRAGVVLPTIGMLCMGAFFGSSLASLTGFLEDAGSGESTGLVYAVLGATAAVAAILVGRLPRRITLAARWIAGASLMALAGVVLALWTTVASIVVVFAFAGIAVGATLVTLFTIGAEAAPVGRLSTTMTMVSSGLIIGQGIMMAVVGTVAGSFGVVAAFWMIAVAGTAMTATATVYSLLVPRPPRQALAGGMT